MSKRLARNPVRENIRVKAPPWRQIAPIRQFDTKIQRKQKSLKPHCCGLRLNCPVPDWQRWQPVLFRKATLIACGSVYG
jgi:hypothetical protein